MMEFPEIMDAPRNVAHYRITAKLGAGGMGEVWLATDTRLGREVALKFLPEAVSHEPDRLARFEREARLLASLNHPKVGAIYGLELQGGGPPFLVLELVHGDTLTAQRAFAGETVSDILAGILRGEPDWKALPADTPPIVRSLLRRCLRKDPARRLQHIGDARIEIEEAQAEPVAAAVAPRPGKP